ncbi:serine hydroxymethyltransferase [Candidatus Gracilibacteria bacterium]|nr:serine hydroxymethyltransferase [Candidatus Gracilibacteria bacterium]
MQYPELQKNSPEEFKILQGELNRQKHGIELIPSENYASQAVIEALGTHFTNKYSEGYPGKRYYGGQEFTDQIEQKAIDLAKKIFNGGHANVQPISGAVMNIATYFALLEPGDTILGMDLSHGGHLTHGHPVTHMSKIFNFVRYKTDQKNGGVIDYENLREMAIKHKPKLILAGFSSYSRNLDWKKFKEIADEVGALTMADVSHIGGLIAGKAIENPMDYGFDVLTTTTHKSLRGPRGGLIVSKNEEIGKKIDKAVFPGLQGGPLMNAVFAKLICFKEADTKEFQDYAKKIILNAKILCKKLEELGYFPMNGGTENHMLLLDITKNGLTGKQAQEVLDKAGITLNMNMIPDDPRKPLDPSGIRFGTPAVTTRGMGEKEMIKIAEFMDMVFKNSDDENVIAEVKKGIEKMCEEFPVPGIR